MKANLPTARTFLWVVLLGCVVCFFVTGASAQRAPRDMPQWEYYVAGFGDQGPSNEKLNSLGAEGWELCTATAYAASDAVNSGRHHYVFKRPKR